MIKDRGPFRRKGVKEYVKRMSKPRDKAIYDSTVTSILETAGYDVPKDPASIYDPDQLWAQLDRYSTKETFENDEFIDSAIRRAFLAFGQRDDRWLEPIYNSDDLKSVIDLKTSAGVFFSSKKDAWEEGVVRAKKVISGEVKPYPCVAMARTQRDNKTRLVWAYPLDMILIEAKFSRPLIEMYKQIRSPLPYKIRRHELGMRMFYTLDRRNNVALDFSKFDSSIHPRLIKVAFRILSTWYPNMSTDDLSEWKLIQDYFINTPIVMHDGNLYTGKCKGVPSGSGFTQLIDSIVNFIIITAAQLKFDLRPHWKKIHVLGDDSVFSTDQDVNLNELAAYFKTKGFTLNVSKSGISRFDEPIHFIGFDWYRGKPHRDEGKVIKSLTQPEKWRERGKDRRSELQRAQRLIFEASALGFNLYTVIDNVFDKRKREQLYLQIEDEGLSGYMQYVKTMDEKPEYWRNASSALFI